MGESMLIVTESAGVQVIGFRQNAILDTATVDGIAAELEAIVQAPGARRIVLDLHDVKFLSSRALGVFVALRKKADENKSKIGFSGVRPELQKVFQLTKLDKLFQCFASVEEATTSLGGG